MYGGGVNTHSFLSTFSFPTFNEITIEKTTATKKKNINIPVVFSLCHIIKLEKERWHEWEENLGATEKENS